MVEVGKIVTEGGSHSVVRASIDTRTIVASPRLIEKVMEYWLESIMVDIEFSAECLRSQMPLEWPLASTMCSRM